MARSIARQAAMQLLYERLSGGDADEASLDLVYEQLSELRPEGAGVLRPSKDEKEYISDVMTGVEKHEGQRRHRKKTPGSGERRVDAVIRLAVLHGHPWGNSY